MAIKVRFFGAFTITCGDRSISEADNRSKKLWKLLQYIVVNRRRQIPQEELTTLLWGEGASGENAAPSLKTLLHRVRNTLDQLEFEDSRKLILQQSGAYYWNPELPCIIDTEEYEIATADMEKAVDREEKLNHALKAMALYKGHFLSDQYHEAWAKEPCERYRRLYLTCYETAIELLSAEKRYDEIVFLSQHAHEIDPAQEPYYFHLVSALIAKGDFERALDCYQNVLDLFYNTYRKTPSDRLRALYRSIVRSANSVELDIAIVREKLRAQAVDRPILCEYDTFKLMFELRQGVESFFSKPAFLILLTLSGAGSEKLPSEKHLDRALAQLTALLEASLARGDIYTRYSVTQMLAIVHMETEDALFDLLQQLQRDFRASTPALPVDLTFKADLVG